MQTWIIIESHLTDVIMHAWIQALKLGMLLQSISPLGGKFTFITLYKNLNLLHAGNL